MTRFTRPRRIRSDDDLTAFSCGEPSLDKWIDLRARANETSGASRTYVTFPVGQTSLAGYFALAAGSIEARLAPGRIRRNMPDPFPAVILARLAVDEKYRSQGLGKNLLRDAIIRATAAAQTIGVRAIALEALNETVGEFYKDLGFVESSSTPGTFLARMDDIHQTLIGTG